MSLLKLYSYRRCPFAIRVRMVLEEKEIPYQLIEEDLSNLSPELLSLHPEGRVPLLVHEQDGLPRRVIYQSTIITEYLDELFPKTRLMPVDPGARAEARLWTYWCDSIFKPDLDLYKYELSKLTASEAEELVQRLHSHFQKWEEGLSRGPYLLGAQMTLADIHLFPFARQFMAIKQPLPGIEKYTQVARWLDSMISRPAFKRVMKPA